MQWNKTSHSTRSIFSFAIVLIRLIDLHVINNIKILNANPSRIFYIQYYTNI